MRPNIYLTTLGLSLSLLFGSGDTLYYDLKIFGIKCGEIIYHYPEKDKLYITAQSAGLIDYFFPFRNDYNTSFDTSSYGIRHYKKIVRQGEFKQRFLGKWDSSLNEIVYDKFDSFQRADSCMTIFTFLARLSREPGGLIDTQWFTMEHEGNLFKSRVLIADTVKIKSSGNTILCNHFRLDLIPSGKQIKMLDRSDYFSQNIIRPEAIKQVWVERKTPGRIIKASVKIGPIAVTATLRQ